MFLCQQETDAILSHGSDDGVKQHGRTAEGVIIAVVQAKTFWSLLVLLFLLHPSPLHQRILSILPSTDAQHLTHYHDPMQPDPSRSPFPLGSGISSFLHYHLLSTHWPEESF